MKLPNTSSRRHPPLRDWQQRCLTKATAQLSSAQPHFLCQATPGAGKMMMAAVLADHLLLRDEIDYVLYLGPSTEVVSRAEETLTDVTGLAMGGSMGARGACYTYQSLHKCLHTCQKLGAQSRVLLIWDESHHAGRLPGTQQGANKWGRALLLLERHMRYTFALSGTPWRTDGRCLPLLRYLDTPIDDEEGDQENEEAPLKQRLVPDFVYTLQEAVRDGVCRRPWIHLVDNPHIQLTIRHTKDKKTSQQKRFSSIPRLLRHPGIGYADLIRHDAPMASVLMKSVAQLKAIRQGQPEAGGLVIAADIEHAEEITQWLIHQGADVCLVTSQTPNAHAKLRAFRSSQQAWVVSVGMVSEGVDIPRLRVCCFLSRIRTEQHFRQVLGRIIRRIGLHDPECFLYALNEPLLRRYSYRIAEDLPDENAVVTLISPEAPLSASVNGRTVTGGQDKSFTDEAANIAFESSTSSTSAGNAAQWEHDVAFAERFIEHLATMRL